MNSERSERCAGCGEMTSRAGIHDDSNYLDNGDGPYCDECFSPRRIGELEEQRDDALAELGRAAKHRGDGMTIVKCEKEALLSRRQIESVDGLTIEQVEQLLSLTLKHDGPTGLVHRAVAEQYREQADALRKRLRETAQILVAEVGADGPTNAEDAARQAVEKIKKLTTCPVCETTHRDGLEACADCYNTHFSSTLRLDDARDRIADLEREVEQLRGQAVQSPVIHWAQEQDEFGPLDVMYARPEHPRNPLITVTGGITCWGRYAPNHVVSGAEVMITATDDADDEMVVAHVQVPLTDDIEGNCSICGGSALVPGADGEPVDCPWCVDGASVMDEAKEIAAALYWSWIRSSGPGGGYVECNTSSGCDSYREMTRTEDALSKIQEQLEVAKGRLRRAMATCALPGRRSRDD